MMQYKYSINIRNDLEMGNPVGVPKKDSYESMYENFQFLHKVQLTHIVCDIG